MKLFSSSMATFWGLVVLMTVTLSTPVVLALDNGFPRPAMGFKYVKFQWKLLRYPLVHLSPLPLPPGPHTHSAQIHNFVYIIDIHMLFP